MSAIPSVPARDGVYTFLLAIVRNATFTADLTANALDNLAIPKGCSLPGEFLLELGAVLRIALWEKAGLRPLLREPLPLACDAWRDLFDRLLHRPESFGGMDAPAPLRDAVFRAFLLEFALSGREELNTDILQPQLEKDDVAELISSFADLLWASRHLGKL